jgi:DNA-binding response OmpR family regulator
MRICLAEDDSALRSSLAFVLRSGGHEVLEAEDGADALECIARARAEGHPADLLITDIRMPGLSGVELLRLLAETDARLPTMVVSGHGDRDLLIDLMRLGCDNFLSKPFEPDEVLEKVAEVMRKVSHEREFTRREQEDLRTATHLLGRETASYRRDLEQLRREVQSAAETYRELLDISRVHLPVRMELRNRTMRELGGDFAGCCGRGRVCDFLVADVAGHDLSASYQTVLIKSFFDENCRTGGEGSAFFHRLSAALREKGRNERMTTGLFLRLDLDAGRGRVVRAGPPPRLHWPRGDAEARLLGLPGDVLGLHERIHSAEQEFDFSPGDRFFLHTDGVPAAAHMDGRTGLKRQLGQEGLEELLGTYAHMDLPRQLDFVWSYVMNFCRGKQADDMLLLGVEVRAQ